MDAGADADTRLIRTIAEGDVRAAGTMLVARFADEVYGLCRAMVRDAVLAEDLSQDVFGRAFAALREFRGEASPRTWILRIARNRCIDHLRAANKETLDPEDPDEHVDDAPLAIDAILRRTDLEAALSSLSESERALVVLRFGHGLEYPELAAAFGLGEGAVRMRLSRAVAKMRGAVECEAAPAPARRRAEVAAAIAPVTRSAPGAAPAGLGSPPSPGAPPPPPRGIAPPAAAPMAAPMAALERAASPLAWSAPHALRARLGAMIDSL